MQRGQLQRQDAARCQVFTRPSTRALPRSSSKIGEKKESTDRRGLYRAGGLRKSMMNLNKEESMRSLGMSTRLDLYEKQLSLRQSAFFNAQDSFAFFDDAMLDSAVEDACARLSGETLPEHVPEERTSLEALAEQAALEGLSDDEQEVYKEEEQYEMEIAPGHYVQFRGVKEIWQAVALGTTIECFCLECGQELVCVDDCEHVVCPDECCRMVNPVFDRPASVTTTPFGAGMGLKKEWVIAATGQVDPRPPATAHSA